MSQRYWQLMLKDTLQSPAPCKGPWGAIRLSLEAADLEGMHGLAGGMFMEERQAERRPWRGSLGCVERGSQGAIRSKG